MTENLPDYDGIELPDAKPRNEYTPHERRAEVWRVMKAKGSPSRVNKAALARRYDVNRSTIYRDVERLREWVDDTLGDDAKLTTRALFEKTVNDLLEADDWRATKAAWDVVNEWNEWLADIGEQHREPDRSELDIEMDARRRDVSYTVVREAPDLPTDETGAIDHTNLGFTQAPAAVDVETTDDLEGSDE